MTPGLELCNLTHSGLIATLDVRDLVRRSPKAAITAAAANMRSGRRVPRRSCCAGETVAQQRDQRGCALIGPGIRRGRMDQQRAADREA